MSKTIQPYLIITNKVINEKDHDVVLISLTKCIGKTYIIARTSNLITITSSFMNNTFDTNKTIIYAEKVSIYIYTLIRMETSLMMWIKYKKYFETTYLSENNNLLASR